MQCNLGVATLMVYLFLFDLRLLECQTVDTYRPRQKLSETAMQFGFGNFDGILVHVGLEAIVLQDLSPFVSRKNNSSIQRFWNVKMLSLIVHTIRYLMMQCNLGRQL